MKYIKVYLAFYLFLHIVVGIAFASLYAALSFIFWRLPTLPSLTSIRAIESIIVIVTLFGLPSLELFEEEKEDDC